MAVGGRSVGPAAGDRLGQHRCEGCCYIYSRGRNTVGGRHSSAGPVRALYLRHHHACTGALIVAMYEGLRVHHSETLAGAAYFRLAAHWMYIYTRFPPSHFKFDVPEVPDGAVSCYLADALLDNTRAYYWATTVPALSCFPQNNVCNLITLNNPRHP